MGWDFTQGATKQDIVKRLTESWTTERGTEVRTLHHCVKGNILWSVIAVGDNLEIGCAVLSKQKDFGWGYKGMNEAMGPAYYSCPLSYLEMVPKPSSPYAEEWREAVRDYHKKPAIAVGTVVQLAGYHVGKDMDPRFAIVSLKPLMARYCPYYPIDKDYGSTVYRLTKRQVATAKIL